MPLKRTAGLATNPSHLEAASPSLHFGAEQPPPAPTSKFNAFYSECHPPPEQLAYDGTHAEWVPTRLEACRIPYRPTKRKPDGQPSPRGGLLA